MRDNTKFAESEPPMIIEEPYYKYNLNTPPKDNKVLDHPSYADSVIGV